MNCLNKPEMQKYLDQEVNSDEMESWNHHLQSCIACQKLWAHSKLELKEIKELMSFIGTDEPEISVPVFKKPKYLNSRRKWILYSSAAAFLVIIVALNIQHSITKNKQKQMLEMNMIINQALYNSDLNKLWNEKQSVITITDENGNLLYTNLND